MEIAPKTLSISITATAPASNSTAKSKAIWESSAFLLQLRAQPTLLALGALAYNLLLAIELRAINIKEHWPKHQKDKFSRLTRRRVDSILRDTLTLAAKVVSHAGKKIIKIPKGGRWSRVIIAIDQQLA